MDLLGKRVIVTGGIGNIGGAIVSKLIQKGALVSIFDIDENKFLKLSEETKSQIAFYPCDLTNADQVERSVNRFHQQNSTIDILVNNAGIIHNAPLLSVASGRLQRHDIADWHRVISTNLTSVFFMGLNVAEKMILKRTRGVIVNISSISAYGNAGQSAYSAAKSGVNALTKTWAKELGPWGIRVVGVAPGYCDTESTSDNMGPETLAEVRRNTPLSRLGKPTEIAMAVISALENDYVNGTILEIDGGLRI